MKASDLFELFGDVAKRVKDITVDGRTLYIRQFSAIERDEYFAWVNANTTKERWTGSSSYLAALGLCDEAGAPLFADPAAASADMGKRLPGHVVEAIAREVSRYNVIGKEAEAELAKN